MTPIEGSKKGNESFVYKNIYGSNTISLNKPKFKVGDKVRISKWKKVLDKEIYPIGQQNYLQSQKF
jgi:hypothetical protein